MLVMLVPRWVHSGGVVRPLSRSLPMEGGLQSLPECLYRERTLPKSVRVLGVVWGRGYRQVGVCARRACSDLFSSVRTVRCVLT